MQPPQLPSFTARVVTRTMCCSRTCDDKGYLSILRRQVTQTAQECLSFKRPMHASRQKGTSLGAKPFSIHATAETSLAGNSTTTTSKHSPACSVTSRQKRPRRTLARTHHRSSLEHKDIPRNGSLSPKVGSSATLVIRSAITKLRKDLCDPRSG